MSIKDETKHVLIDFTQMKKFCEDPVIYDEAESIYITDIDGKRYMDGMAGIFAVNSGYNNPKIIEAVEKQLHTLSFQNPMGATNNVAIELAKVLSEICPPGMNTVKLLNSGSEAIESAMKMARQYYKLIGKPGKIKFISRYGSWHGATFGAMSISGISENKEPFEPGLPGCVHMMPPYCYRCPYDLNYPECNILCASILKKIIQSEGPDTVAAVVMTPIEIRNVITPPREYLQLIQKICTEMDVLLIIDEVITGFGRLGRMFACEFYDIIPDFLCMAKGMTGGYGAGSAMVVHERVAKAFWGDPEDDNFFKHGHTYGGNPLSSAAALANLEYMKETSLPEKVSIQGQHLKEKFMNLYTYSIVGDIRGEGLLLGIEFVADRETRRPFPPEVSPGLIVQKKAKEKGLLIRAAQNWIAVGPPLIISHEEVDKLYAILESCIAEVDQVLRT
jgi:adenosylmethionine-8-amino-7-oxononanoate aminotransferase